MNPQTAEMALNSDGRWYLALNPAFGNRIAWECFPSQDFWPTSVDRFRRTVQVSNVSQGTQPSIAQTLQRFEPSFVVHLRTLSRSSSQDRHKAYPTRPPVGYAKG